MYSKTNKFRKFLISLLSLMIAIMLAFVCACSNTNDDDNDDDDSSSSTEEVSDYQTVSNGDFEFNTDEDTTYPYSTSISWTRSNDKSVSSAVSSSNSSGIIDTSDTAYGKLTASSKPVESESNGETVYFNPRTPAYYGLVKNEYDADDEDKRINPNVAGTKVLMINNKVSSKPGQGTAQKFTSTSTLSVSQKGYAKISLWVMTYGLDTVVADKKASGEYGAYVSITNSMGSSEYENVLIDNINTNGEWANVVLYVQGSEINSSSYTITLGLGRGSKSNTDGYVEGFAYFDNVSITKYTKSEFTDLNVSADKTVSVTESTSKADLTVDLKNTTYTDNGSQADYVDEATAKAKYTTKSLMLSYPVDFSYSNLGNGTFAYNTTVANNYTFNAEGNVTETKTFGSLTASVFGDNYNTIFGDFAKIGDNDTSVAYMYFANPSSATYTSEKITIASESYKVVTFFAKSGLINSNSVYKAKVTLKEDDKDAVDLFSDVSALTEEGEYGYWTKYTVAVYNPTDRDAAFTINMSFGMIKGEFTDIPKRDLPTGYAVIADIKKADVDETTYENILTSTTVNKQTVYGEYLVYEDETDNTDNDEYNITPDITQQSVIAFEPTKNVTSFTFKGDATKTVRGIVNSKYINANGTYGHNQVAIANLDSLNSLKTLRSDGITYNNYAQAIVLSNKEATSSSFQTTKATFAANSYSTIIVRLRVTGDAQANIYLSSTDYNETNGNYELLSIKGDDNNSANITAKVTNGSHLFDGKWTEVCFYVATGNEAIDYRVEIWNGSRDGSTNSVGTIYIDNVYVSESDADCFAFDKAQYKDEFAALGDAYEFSGFNYTRTATVLYTDENGKDATKTRTFAPTEVFTGNDLVKFVSYETIDVDNEIDERTTDDDSSDDTDTDESDPYKASLSQNLPLLIISGIIAGVLIIAVVAVIIKQNVKKKAVTTKKKQSYYDRNTREKTLNKIVEKKAKIDVEKDDEPAEYDYEEAAKIGEETTETTEEVIDVEELEKEPEVVAENTTEETVNNEDDGETKND